MVVTFPFSRNLQDLLSPNTSLRIAALDMGSNALRLLVADCKDDAIVPVWRQRQTTRLGQGLDSLSQGNRLAFAAKQRADEALGLLVGRARELQARRIILVATHASRKALDGAAFVDFLKNKWGLDEARVLSVEQEARLTRLGVLSVQADSRAWVLDIGAGSTELAPLDSHQPGIYLPCGALNLKEKYIEHDPPTVREMKNIRTFVGRQVDNWPRVKQLTTTSGTATCLAALDLGLPTYNPDLINNHIVKRPRLMAIVGHLSRLPLPEREKVLNTAADRADIIIAGLLIMSEILNALRLKALTVVDAGILEGCLSDFLTSCKEKN